MKKWLLAAGLGLALATSAQAADKIAIVNMGSLFQQVAQKTGVSNTLENEFKGRASELQRMETDLQAKMKKLQSMKAGRQTGYSYPDCCEIRCQQPGYRSGC